MTITVEEGRLSHLRKVLDDIRPADIREAYAGSGNGNFRETANATIKRSDLFKVALKDGVPMVFWGCRGGTVWLFATTQAEKCQFSLHRVLRPQLKYLLDLWPTLECWTDSRNTLHHTWLEWLGFKLVQEMPILPLGMFFRNYRKDADHVH